MTEAELDSLLAELTQNPPSYTWKDWAGDGNKLCRDEVFRNQEQVAVTVHPTNDGPPLPEGMTSPLPHSHEFVEISYVWSGSCSVDIEGENVPLEPGDFVLLDTRSTHHPNVEKGCILINLDLTTDFFDSSFFQNFDREDVLAEFFASMLYSQKKEKRYIVFQPHNDPRVRQLVAMMVQEYCVREICNGRIIENLIMVLFSTMVRIQIQQNARLSVSAEDDTMVSEILRYMSRHIQTVTRDSLADHFGYSYSYISSVLQSATGMTFSGLKNSLRLQQAQRLLQSSGEPITAIAKQSGFSNVTSFYELFRRQYGMSPQNYREKNRKR